MSQWQACCTFVEGLETSLIILLEPTSFPGLQSPELVFSRTHTFLTHSVPHSYSFLVIHMAFLGTVLQNKPGTSCMPSLTNCTVNSATSDHQPPFNCHLGHARRSISVILSPGPLPTH